jgi:hypothetical protein
METTEAGTTPEGAAIAMTAPDDTPERLSAVTAASVLARLRHPKPAPGNDRGPHADNDRTVPDAIVGGIEEFPGAQPGGNEAGEPQALPGETERADREAALPPIEPPRSWTKEDKELFTSLPRDTQERLAERERSRESDFLRRQNEAADKLRGLTAKEQAVEQARQHYEAALPQLFQTLLQQQAGEFADVKTMADVERLAREDWPRYLQWDLAQKKLAHVSQQMLDAQQRQVAEQQQQFSEFARRQDDLFKQKVPDMGDDGKAAQLQKAAVAVLNDLGFEDAELVPLWNGRQGLSLRDHRVQLLIRDATLWREAQAKARAAASKPVPPVQRPGVSQPRGAAQEAHVQALTTKLEKTGSLKDAAALLRARRAAR